MHLSNCIHVKAEKVCKLNVKKKKGKKVYAFEDKRWQCQTVQMYCEMKCFETNESILY